MRALALPLRARSRRLVLPRSPTGLVGLLGLGVVLGIAFVGPLVSPHSATAIVGAPFAAPTAGSLLGTDFLGRDVLSRVLSGGRSMVLLAVLATTIAYVIGGTLGLIAGYSRTRLEGVLMRALDIVLAFPPLLFLLVLASGLGPGRATIVVGTAFVHVPGVARVIRAATLEVSMRGYVEAAVARGERMTRILSREILPNITPVVAADAGPRLTVTILIIAGLNFFGLGIPPPAADWASMISENRSGLAIQPWGALAPAALIAVLTIAVNLLADAAGRPFGRSIEEELVRP